MTSYRLTVCLPAGTTPHDARFALAARLAPLQAAAEAAGQCPVPITAREFTDRLPPHLSTAVDNIDDATLTWREVADLQRTYIESEKAAAAPLHTDGADVACQHWADVRQLITSGALSDWYSWPGRYEGTFAADASAAELGRRAASWLHHADEPPHLRSAPRGGPIGLLDLAALQYRGFLRAQQLIYVWQHVTAGLPTPRPWAAYLARHHTDPSGYPRAQAREDFHRQPAVAALKARDDRLRPGADDVVVRRRVGYAALVAQMALGKASFCGFHADREAIGDGLLALDGRLITVRTSAQTVGDITGPVGAAWHAHEYLCDVSAAVVLVPVELPIWPPPPRDLQIHPDPAPPGTAQVHRRGPA